MTLYFDKRNDCFRIDSYGRDCEFVCDSYEISGYKFIVWESEDNRIKLNIQSNFKYGSVSYFYFTMSVNGKNMLNFENYGENNQEYLVRFNVMPSSDYWRDLFMMIESVYSERETRTSVVWLNNQFEKVLTQLEKLIDRCLDTKNITTSIVLKQYSITDPLIEINKTNCTRIIAKKLNTLLTLQEFSKVSEIDHIKTHMLQICVKATKLLSETYKSSCTNINALNNKANVEIYEKCIDSIYDYFKGINKRQLFLLNF